MRWGAEASRWRASLVITAALLFACVTKDDGEGADGSGTSSSTSGATATDPSATSTTSQPGSCEDYLPDENIGPAVAITVENGSDAPVWVPAVGCGGAPLVTILDGSGDAVAHYGDECSPTQCFEFLDAEDCTLGCNDCAPPSWLRLPAGSMVLLNWSGVRRTTLEMTAQCAPGNECQRDCVRADQAEAGTYDLQVRAYRTCTGTCDCGGGTGGEDVCPLWEPVEPMDEVVASAALAYPEQTAISVVIPGP